MYIIVDDVTEEKPSPNASKGYYHIGFCAVLKIMLSIFVKIRKCLFGDLNLPGELLERQSHVHRVGLGDTTIAGGI